MKIAVLSWVVICLLSACAIPKRAPEPAPIIPEHTERMPAAMRGHYELDPKGHYYAGSSITLGDGAFTVDRFTDVVPPNLPPREKGRFVYARGRVWLKFSSGHISEKILVRKGGRYLMFSPKEYDDYLASGKLASRVLFQR